MMACYGGVLAELKWERGGESGGDVLGKKNRGGARRG